VLAELDQFLRSHAQAADASARDPPSWWVEHTTAPFEAAAFAPRARCGGYSRAWAETARALGSPRAEPRFATTAPALESEASIDLAELIRDLTQPARAWLRRAGVSQREPEQDDWRESAEVGPLNAFRKRERAAWLLERYPALSGLALARQLLSERGLPAGAAGARWAAELAQAAEALRQARTLWLPEAEPARRCELDLACAGIRVTGVVGGLHGKRLLRLKFGRLRARAALAAWLEALALRASGVDVDDVVLLGCGETAEAMRLVPAADSALQFEALVTLARRARREALPLFPESGAAYVRALRRGGDPSSALESARVEWTGDDKRAGEGRYGGLALYTRDWADPLAAPFSELALQLHSSWLAAGGEVAL
jgi:exodeoxyribonuclease V gamma subunit